MKRNLLPFLTLALGLVVLPAMAVTSKTVIGRPKPPRALAAYAEQIHVEKPLRYGNLTLFPISVTKVAVPDVKLTFEQAVDKGLVEVTELDSSEVNRLRIRNRGKEPVFIMAGEMLRGGKQDRIIGDDLILPPKTTLTVSVFCVEHGRWDNREVSFKAHRSVAGVSMRKAAQAKDQGAVWSAVAEQQESLKAPSTTGSLRSVHESDEVKRSAKPYLKELTDLPKERPTACGVVAVADGQILAADLFSSRELFRKLWPQLLDAYVIDALEGPPVRPMEHRHMPPVVDRDDIEQWLRGLRTAGVSEKDTPGEGELYDVIGNFTGSALVYGKGVVHLTLFPAEVEIMTREPDFNSLDFRRQRTR